MARKKKNHQRNKSQYKQIQSHSQEKVTSPVTTKNLSDALVLKSVGYNVAIYGLLGIIAMAIGGHITFKLESIKDQHTRTVLKIADHLQIPGLLAMVYVSWRHRNFKGGDVHRTRRFSKTMLLLAAYLFAIAVFEFLYVYGFPAWVSSFLSAQIPQIGVKINKAIAAFVTFMTSGISGLFGAIILNIVASYFYDRFIKPTLIKRGFLKQ